MSVRTKPVRIFEADVAPIRLLAEIQQRSPAEVVHRAIAEYLHSHKDPLASRFAESQRAVASGDLEGLGALLAPGAAQLADQLLTDLEQYR
jgi:hypothetical protein